MEFFNLSPKVNKRWDYLNYLCTANAVDVKSIVEIGTWDGENAVGLRKCFPDAYLYLVDPYQPFPSYLENGGPMSENPEAFKAAYKTVCKQFENDPKTTMIKHTSLEGASLVPNNIDLIFIDGDHSYEHVKQDILTWRPKVRPGGLLTGHDYSLLLPDLMKAVNEIFPNQFIVGRDMVWATMI